MARLDMQHYAYFSRSTLLAVSIFAVSLFAGKSQAQLINGDFADLGSLHSGVLLSPGQTTSDALPGWIATRGDLPDSNVYVFSSGNKSPFTPNVPPGFTNAVWLDGSTGYGQNKFTTGSSIEQTFSLNPGTYKLTFSINTEVGSLNGVTKGGTSGILVDLTGTNLLTGGLSDKEFTATSPVPATRANTPWHEFTTDFTVAAGNKLMLSFEDDPNPLLGNNLRSSNIMLGGISIAPVPEPAPLTLVGVGAISLIGFQVLKKRRRA